MRRLLISFLLVPGICAAISSATAADYETPTLRGSDSFVPAFSTGCCSRWAGIYAGGQIGTGVMSVDFSHASQSVIANMLRVTSLEAEAQVSTWQVLGKSDTHGRTWGGFVGYNTGWESLILGFEINYSRMDFHPSATTSPLRRLAPTSAFNYDVTVTGAAGINLTDVATLRGRAGWEVGNFLPYAMISVAAARADLTRSASAFGTQSSFDVPPIVTPFSFTQTERKDGAFLFGWALGAGVDVLVMPNVFLRAEFEYLALSPVWTLTPTMFTARAGLGYRF